MTALLVMMVNLGAIGVISKSKGFIKELTTPMEWFFFGVLVKKFNQIRPAGRHKVKRKNFLKGY